MEYIFNGIKLYKEVLIKAVFKPADAKQRPADAKQGGVTNSDKTLHFSFCLWSSLTKLKTL